MASMLVNTTSPARSTRLMKGRLVLICVDCEFLREDPWIATDEFVAVPP